MVPLAAITMDPIGVLVGIRRTITSCVEYSCTVTPELNQVDLSPLSMICSLLFHMNFPLVPFMTTLLQAFPLPLPQQVKNGALPLQGTMKEIWCRGP